MMRRVKRAAYKDCVFVNVPLDKDYERLFDAIVFAIYDCGFVARSALESDDASQVRIQKLYELIAGSKYGIHDISRTELDSVNHLPRFNMPFELGIFLGCKKYGTGSNKQKRALVLDRRPYRYQKFCSDIAGQDIRAHNNEVNKAIKCVRNWLRASPDTAGKTLPGGQFIYDRYIRFRRQLPTLCKLANIPYRELHFNDYTTAVSAWLKAHPR